MWPCFRYCNIVWGLCNETLTEKLQSLQNKVVTTIAGQSYEYTNHDLEKQVVETKENSESIVAKYKNAKIELEKLYDYIADRIILKSKVHCYEKGEKNAKYFLSLGKNNKAKSHLRKVIDRNGEEITDQGNIPKEFKCFYSNPYSRKSETEQDCLDYLKSINAPKLSETDKETCEGKLTVQSCWNALNSMKSGKSPSKDGLTKEFCTYFFR